MKATRWDRHGAMNGDGQIHDIHYERDRDFLKSKIEENQTTPEAMLFLRLSAALAALDSYQAAEAIERYGGEHISGQICRAYDHIRLALILHREFLYKSESE